MIDYFALALIHGLLVIGMFRMVQNDALDPAIKLPMRNKAKAQTTGQVQDHKSDPL